MKIPQLRFVAVDFCDSKCIYCRPSGEAALSIECNRSLSLDTAVEVAKVYKKYGGNDIKITGGDPIYWKQLIEFIRILKKELRFKKVGIVTRSIKIIDIIDDLIDSGLDSIIFSLDTIYEDKYNKITGKTDFKEYIKVINHCANKTYCKINTVVMKGINDDEFDKIIDFGRENNIKEIKFLDLISDLHDGKINNSKRLEENYKKQLKNLYTNLYEKSEYLKKITPELLLQEGGLGHPQKLYKIDGLNIVLKDATSGAWYGKCCEDCKMYPCHDALMALRVLPSNCFQLCLLNDEKVYKFDKENTEEVFLQCLDVYKNATFKKED